MKKLLLSTFFVFGIILPLSAHPHIMLTTDLKFEFSGKICNGVWVEWGFDRFFSSMIIQDYDADSNGIFSDGEIQDIHDHAFINLKRYGYFVSFRTGNKRKSPEEAEKFSARQKDGQLFYKFFIPLGSSYGSNFYFSIFDPTYYCAVKYTDKPVVIKQNTGPVPLFKLAENKKYPVYYNPYGASDDTATYTKWKPGLETAYPKEVHIFFEK